jgi:hypothetical protein
MLNDKKKRVAITFSNWGIAKGGVSQAPIPGSLAFSEVQ